MKTTTTIALFLLALALPMQAQQTVSSRTSLAAAALDPAIDILPVVDISAGTSGSKKITIDAVFEGWGMTAAGESLAKAADAAAQRTALGLGTAATANATAFEAAFAPPAANGYILSSTTAGVRSWIAPASGAGDMIAANNLSDLTNAATARTNLQLGTAATSASTAFEAALGNPATSGFVLSSTTAGVRSWIAAGSGGGGTTLTDSASLSTALSDETGEGQAVFAGMPTINMPTINMPTLNVDSEGSDATGDIYYRNSAGALTRLPISTTNGHVLTSTGSIPSWAAAAGGGGGSLTNFTEAISTASPNFTIPAVSLTATNAATDVDAVIAPKGVGALLAAVPTSSAAGGNKRGSNAVDFQTIRSAAAEVASGSYATIGGGANNKASSNYAAIGGGNSNAATNTYAFIGGGSGNAASGSYSAILGGQGNTASNSYATATGYSTIASGYASFTTGRSTRASGLYSSAGGFDSTTRGLFGAEVYAAGLVATQGDAQRASYVLNRITTDATVTEFTAGGSTPSSTNVIVLPDNSSYSFTGQVVARTSGGETAAWRFSGTIKRGGTATATALVGTPTQSDTNATAGATGWVLTITANTSDGALRLQGTGAAATQVRWVASVQTVEVVY